jgi:polysaccharide pyruvyl transferase WcaK-like protein
MTGQGRGARRQHAAAVGSVPRVGLFGLLGSGNIGNDGSLDAVLAYLRDKHPDAVVDFMCAGPDAITERYGLSATRLHWNRLEYQTAANVRAILQKGVGKLVDAFRTAAWVRQHDAVIVPGMGVLEATLPLRPWGFPYSLFLLCLSGRLVGTKVALVSVGANTSGHPLTRRLFTTAARLAYYRSYRDDLSRDAMGETGLDVADDNVYPDLAFALPTPAGTTGDTGTAGVGVMSYHGTNDDRGRADEVYAAYVAKMKRFARWLVDGGHRIRLFTGDKEDETVVAELIRDLRAYRPDLDPSSVVAEPVSSLVELMQQMTLVDTIVATRYHNVLCALKVSKPTLSIGYSAKNDVLMADMGLGEFCQDIRSLDVDRLVDQFTALESRREQLIAALANRNAANAARLEQQFATLSVRLFPRAPGQAETKAVQKGTR